MDYESICALVINLCDKLYLKATEGEETTENDSITLGAEIGENRRIKITIQENSIMGGDTE